MTEASKALTLIFNGEKHFFEGVMEGRIARSRSGEGGFGYDPYFYLPEFGKTAAELTAEEKNSISHRGKALRAMLKTIGERWGW